MPIAKVASPIIL
jgi:hypothetical protein